MRRWGIYVHGGIDGHSRYAFIFFNFRLIFFLKASDNNQAQTVFDSFLESTQAYGLPLHVRFDHGQENNLVSDYMRQRRGDSGCIAGKSTHNQRIERLWRDVFDRALISYYDYFRDLETKGVLDVDNPRDISELKKEFLPKINDNLYNFIKSWNHHPLSTCNNKPPVRLFYDGLYKFENAEELRDRFLQRI